MYMSIKWWCVYVYIVLLVVCNMNKKKKKKKNNKYDIGKNLWVCI